MDEIDIAQEYIKKRIIDLEGMIGVYVEAGLDIPVDFLARRAELCRMRAKLDEYKDVMEYGEDKNKTANA